MPYGAPPTACISPGRADLDFGALLSMLGTVIELAALNLLLGADNAILIALVCRPLPPDLRKTILSIGLGGAIALRIALAVLVNELLYLPALRLAAAVLLIGIAVRLLDDPNELEREATPDEQAVSSKTAKARLWQYALIVVAADAVMSLDNIVALVAVSQGNMALLVFGLILSVPALLYGTAALARILDQWPFFVLAGAMLLGWIAGQIAVGDDLVSAWVSRQAPALAIVAPALCACYVYLCSQPRQNRRLETG
jgi:YjbE family integral membrane protein